MRRMKKIKEGPPSLFRAVPLWCKLMHDYCRANFSCTGLTEQ